MELGNVKSFKVVVWRFDFRAFYDGEADGEKDVFDSLQDLTDEMVRADWADDSREGEVDALADAGGFAGTSFDDFAALFDFGFDVSAKLIEFLAYDPLEFLSGGLEPVVCYLS